MATTKFKVLSAYSGRYGMCLESVVWHNPIGTGVQSTVISARSEFRVRPEVGGQAEYMGRAVVFIIALT